MGAVPFPNSPLRGTTLVPGKDEAGICPPKPGGALKSPAVLGSCWRSRGEGAVAAAVAPPATAVDPTAPKIGITGTGAGLAAAPATGSFWGAGPGALVCGAGVPAGKEEPEAEEAEVPANGMSAEVAAGAATGPVPAGGTRPVC